jgi:hypothetical protein
MLEKRRAFVQLSVSGGIVLRPLIQLTKSAGVSMQNAQHGHGRPVRGPFSLC